MTREHVPQRALGGQVMTLTCRACNSGLGSRVEDELKNWFDDAVGSVRFSGGGVPGRRRSPRVLLRWTDDGEFVLLPDVGRNDADLQAMLASGELQMEFTPPIPAIWRLAALKHAYLGACLCLRGIPDTPMASQVRADLVAARDASSRRDLPSSDIAIGLRVARSFKEARDPRVALVQLVDPNEETIDVGLSFAGTLFVSWPLEPVGMIPATE